MVYKSRGIRIFNELGADLMTRDAAIKKAVKEYKIKEITAINYYEEWKKDYMNLTEHEPDKRSAKVKQAIARKHEKEKSEMEESKEVKDIETMLLETDKEKEPVPVGAEMHVQFVEMPAPFKLSNIQFDGSNGSYIISGNLFALLSKDKEVSLSFESEEMWNVFKSEVDSAYEYAKKMGVM